MRKALFRLARLTPAGVALAMFVSVSGCGSNQQDPVSDYDRMKQAEENAAATVTNQGVKAKLLHHALGDAWSVDMSKMTITDDLLRQVQKMGRVRELDLSNSNVTDEQLGLISQLGLSTLLTKFDLSNTNVTDAGFQKLQNLALLMELNLTGTKVTPAAVQQFLANRQSDTRVMPMFKNPKVRLK